MDFSRRSYFWRSRSLWLGSPPLPGDFSPESGLGTPWDPIVRGEATALPFDNFFPRKVVGNLHMP